MRRGSDTDHHGLPTPRSTLRDDSAPSRPNNQQSKGVTMLKTFRTMAAAAVILLLGSSRAVRFFTLLVALLLASPTRADEPVPLKQGPGLDVVTLFCDTCHTLNYIRMNSVFLTPDAWKAEVTKMHPTTY